MCLRQLTFSLIVFCFAAECCDLAELFYDKQVSVEASLVNSEVVFRGLANFAAVRPTTFADRKFNNNDATLNNKTAWKVFHVCFEFLKTYKGAEVLKQLGVSSSENRKINVTFLISSQRSCFEDVSYVPREYIVFANSVKVSGEQLQSASVVKWDPSVDQRIWKFLGWSFWSDWTPCSVSCGTGIQQRTRHCLQSGCPGFNVEQRQCNLFSCDKTVNPLALNKSSLFHPSRDRWQTVPDRPTAWRLKPNSYIWVPSVQLFAEKNISFPREFAMFFTIRVLDTTMGTIFSLRSRRRQDSYLSVEVAGSDLKLVHAAANGTDVVRIPTAIDDTKWHHIAISIKDHSTVESFVDCEWSRTDILHNQTLDVPEDSDLIIGYLFTGDIEQLTIVPDPNAVNLQCSMESTPIVDPQIQYSNGKFELLGNRITQNKTNQIT